MGPDQRRRDLRHPRRRLCTGAAGGDDEDERTRREEKALHPGAYTSPRPAFVTAQKTNGMSIFVERLYRG